MKHVKKAKILTCDDLAQVLNFISKMIHAERNRALFLVTVLGGLSVKETAALLVGDVLDEFGKVKDEIHLRPEQTKNRREHNVKVCKGLKTELQRYVATFNEINPSAPFFYTQKNFLRGFTQNTLTQHFFWMYKKSGIDASSESGKNTYLHLQHSKTL
jgi:integrase/recombinase XerD